MARGRKDSQKKDRLARQLLTSEPGAWPHREMVWTTHISVTPWKSSTNFLEVRELVLLCFQLMVRGAQWVPEQEEALSKRTQAHMGGKDRAKEQTGLQWTKRQQKAQLWNQEELAGHVYCVIPWQWMTWTIVLTSFTQTRSTYMWATGLFDTHIITDQILTLHLSGIELLFKILIHLHLKNWLKSKE